jgi:dipeptidyl aminopeptidase/acylaminoacyl peptidase
MEEVSFGPEGTRLVFTARDVGGAEPWSTDFDLYATTPGGKEPICITESNEAWDTGPVHSPDGRHVAYLAMDRPGYEADRFRVVLYDTMEARTTVLTEDWDYSPRSITWAPDGKSMYVTAADVGQVSLFRLDLDGAKVTNITKVYGDGHVRSPTLTPDGQRIVFGRDTLASPVELFTIRTDGTDLRPITDLNGDRLATMKMSDYEQFSFNGWNDETVYAYMVKPVDFDPSKKYPVAFLIHGGPQGSFGNDFHYRWNPQVYTGAGYAAVMVDFHGSTGYGQDFTDSIRGDWGGKPLEDLQKGLAAALERYPWMDGDRVCALGASYGGYMINWIAGNWPDRFRCLVNHDGTFDTRSMYYETEELWFPEWDTEGTPWTNPEGYAKHNPVLHVDKWKTPMLVIHGALDYRVPETQGIGAFNALQRRGVPSRFLYFPDENHWVLKPHNGVYWHRVVLDWLAEWSGGDR